MLSIIQKEVSKIILPEKINIFENIPNELALYLISKGFCCEVPKISGRQFGPMSNEQFDGKYLTKINGVSKSEAGFYLYRTNGSLLFQLYNFILEIEKNADENILTRRKGLIERIAPPISFKTLDEEIQNEWFYREFP